MIAKKRITAVITAAIILSGNVQAAIIDAVDEKNLSDNKSKSIVISGSVPLSDDNNLVANEVTLEILKKDVTAQQVEKYLADTSLIEYIDQVSADSEGKYSFTYTKKADSGNYLIRIGYYTKDSEDDYVKTHIYVNPEDFIELANEIKKAYADKDTAALEATLNKYTDKGIISIEKWNSLNESGEAENERNFVLRYMVGQKLADNAQISDVEKHIDEGMTIYAVHNKSAEEVKAALNNPEFINTIGINEKVYNYFNAEENLKIHDAVYFSLANCSMESKSIDDVKKLVYNSMILKELSGVMWQEVYEILENNNDVIGIDFSAAGAYEKLSKDKKNKALSLFNDSINTIHDAGEIKGAFDKAVKLAANENTGGTGGNRGNSDSRTDSGRSTSTDSGKTIVQLPSSNKTNNTQMNNAEINFSDMKDFEWAQNAVKTLADKGIVSGDGNGTFRPYASVTREEFLKMAVNALKLSNKADSAEFSDVNSEAWYYPYVCSGIYYKLINGMGNNEFGIGKSIKRCDVAVILVRILSMYGKEYTMKDIVYKDVIKDEIGYAYEAIYAVSEAKLMNGTSSVTFEPNREITRAEAAVVVERLITLLENN